MELLRVEWMHIASHPHPFPSLSNKGQLCFSVSLSLTILFRFHAKDGNKDNGKKGIIIICTEFFSLSSVVLSDSGKTKRGG